jgi:hypothetical protein
MEIIDNIVITDTAIPALSYRVDIVPDPDTYPEDFGCYDETTITAWHNDEWRYVGVIVTPIIAGVDLPLAEASLWGTEYGTLPHIAEDGTVYGVVDRTAETLANEYPGPDLIEEARAYLVKTLGPVILDLIAVANNL